MNHHGSCPAAQAWDIPNVPCGCPCGWPRRELTYSKPTRRKKAKGPTARYRAKRKRAEGPVIKRVRAACVERDGYCRIERDYPQAKYLQSPEWHCGGMSEWAHLENQRRGRTRGMKPELRHNTAGTAMLCTAHHAAYDAGKLRIASMTGKGADGPLTWRTA